MALEFERNIDLEEIDSDAPFGIIYLAHQSVAQKIIFFGSATVAAAFFVASQFVFELPFAACFVIEIILGSIGFLFGANQCEYLSIAQYLKLIFFKPIKYAKYVSSEDITLMKDAVERVNDEAAKNEKAIVEATQEGQRRMLIVVVALIIGFVILGLGLKALSSYKAGQMTHHTIGAMLFLK